MPELNAVSEQLTLALEQESVLRQQAAMDGRDISKDDKKAVERFSFRKAILTAAEGRALDGVEAEMHQEAIREAKAEGRSISGIGVPYMLLANKTHGRASTGQNITTAGDGGYLKQEEPLLFLAALRNRMVVSQLGAKFLTGLVGDFPLVTGSLFTANWSIEDSADTTQKLAFTKATMTPKRVQATGALTLQLLKQSTPDVEKLIEQELIDSIAQALQAAVINGSGAAGQPLGILGTAGIGDVPGGANGLAPAWGHIVDLESKVLIANADVNALGYLTNAKVRGKLKQVVKAANTAEFVWDKDGMNGYKASVTGSVPSNLVKGASGAVCSAIIFAEWSRLIIGQWGGLDMIVDPYSLKKRAEVEVTALSFYDVACMYPAAFAAMKDALTV
jgi:HK97 family phage major capsid protein